MSFLRNFIFVSDVACKYSIFIQIKLECDVENWNGLCKLLSLLTIVILV